MQLLNRSATESTTWTIKELADRQRDDEIYLDLAFQSSERWSKNAMHEYLKSVFSGFTPNPIILANIENCMNYCGERWGKDCSDYKYFEDKLNQGFKYISVDGNNRTRTLMRFFFGGNNGRSISLKDGYTYRMSGMTNPDYNMRYTPNGSQTYKVLPPDMKEHISTIKIPVFIVNESTCQELHDMFIAVNNGVSLNAQEKRNAIVCTVANEIRELANKYGFLKLYFNEGNRQRRKHEEFLVTALVHIANGFVNNIAAEHKDAAYNNNSTETKNLRKLKEVLKDMDGIIQYESKATKNNRGIPSQASLLDLVMLVNYLREHNRTILDDMAFFEWFAKTLNILRRDTVTIIVPDSQDPRTFYGAQRATDKEFREARLAAILAHLHKLPDGVLSPERDAKRFGEAADRITLWRTQEHKCPETGRDIPWMDVLDGNKTHLDHILPHSKGGKTVLENLQLVYKSANLLKSDK